MDLYMLCTCVLYNIVVNEAVLVVIPPKLKPIVLGWNWNLRRSG
jgi:hypothetical protein